MNVHRHCSCTRVLDRGHAGLAQSLDFPVMWTMDANGDSIAEPGPGTLRLDGAEFGVTQVPERDVSDHAFSCL